MRVFFAIFLRFLHSTFRLGRGRGFVNIGVTNIWVIELGRIFGKIFKPNTFEIRPRNYQIHPPSNPYEILSPRNTHHCRLVDAAVAECSILKFQNYSRLVNDVFDWVNEVKWWLTIQPAPIPYTNFCASAHFLRNSSVASNWVDKAHSKRLTDKLSEKETQLMKVPPNQRGLFMRVTSVCIRLISKRENRDQIKNRWKPTKRGLLQTLVKYASSFAAATP